MRITTNPPDSDKIKNERQAEIQKQLKFVGSTTIKPNHRLYKICNETQVVEVAEIEKSATFHGGVKSKAIILPGYTYITAMNKQNALKKYRKQLNK